MKFLNSMRFLNADKRVQDYIIDLWEPEIGDLYNWKDDDEHDSIVCNSCSSENSTKACKANKRGRVPLLTVDSLSNYIIKLVDELTISRYSKTNEAVIIVCNGEKRIEKTCMNNDSSIIDVLWPILTSIICEEGTK